MGEVVEEVGDRRVVFRQLMEAGRTVSRAQVAHEMASPVIRDVDGLFIAGGDLARRFLRDPHAESGMAVAARLWADRDIDASFARSVAHGFPPYMEPDLHGAVRPLLASAIAEIDDKAVALLVDRSIRRCLASASNVEVRLVEDILAPAFQRWLSDTVGDELSSWPAVKAVARSVPALIDVTARRRDLAVVVRAGASALECRDQFLAAVARCRNDRLADLPRTVGEALGERAESDEVTLRTLGTVGFLQSASGDTTIVMAAEIIALLSQPSTWDALRSGALPVARLTAEALRLSSPIRVSARRTTRSLELDDTRLPAGEVIFVALGAINWKAPSLLTHGPHGRHMAFGHGAHFCPGWQQATSLGIALAESIVSNCSRPPQVVAVHRGAHRCIAEHVTDVTLLLRS